MPRGVRLPRRDGPPAAAPARSSTTAGARAGASRASAVGNPGELASRLTGLDVEVVEAVGGPSGDKLFALWNPPIVDEETGQRRSALAEASWLMGRLVADDVRTIGFTRSRGRGAAGRVHAPGGRRRGPPRPDRVLPRRLPRGGPSPDRTPARGRRAARGRRHDGAGAGIDIGLARRRRADRLPGDARLDVAAGGPRGTAGPARSRCSSRRTTRSTSTSCTIPRTCSTSRPRPP